MMALTRRMQHLKLAIKTRASSTLNTAAFWPTTRCETFAIFERQTLHELHTACGANTQPSAEWSQLTTTNVASDKAIDHGLSNSTVQKHVILIMANAQHENIDTKLTS